MESDLATRGDEVLDLTCNLRDVITRSPPRWGRTASGPPRISFPWYNKERGIEATFNVEIPVKIIPKIVGKTQMHKGQRKSCHPVGSQVSGRSLPRTKLY